MTRHVSIVNVHGIQPHHDGVATFAHVLLRSCLFGRPSSVSLAIGLGCAVGGVYMLRRLVRIREWGRALRFAIATVIVIGLP